VFFSFSVDYFVPVLFVFVVLDLNSVHSTRFHGLCPRAVDTGVIFWQPCPLPCVPSFSFFSATSRDWPWRTSPKWPILCRVGRKTFT